MAWAKASTSPGSGSTYKPNPYTPPDYGPSNKPNVTGPAVQEPPKYDTPNGAHPDYWKPETWGKKTVDTPPPPPPPAKKEEPPPPVESAMNGLSMAIGQSGPTPGWADDPALAETSGNLGSRVGNDAMGILSELINKRGRLY